MGATSRAVTDYHSLFVLLTLFSFGHSIVCLSSIYGFWFHSNTVGVLKEAGLVYPSRTTVFTSDCKWVPCLGFGVVFCLLFSLSSSCILYAQCYLCLLFSLSSSCILYAQCYLCLLFSLSSSCILYAQCYLCLLFSLSSSCILYAQCYLCLLFSLSSSCILYAQCYVCLLFVCLRLVSYVLNVTRVSEFFIFDCSFGFLKYKYDVICSYSYLN